MASEDKDRTVAFFRLVAESEDGKTVHRLSAEHAWPTFLENLYGRPLAERTVTAADGTQIVGQVLNVDDDFALKLMTPRDRNSWIEILRTEADDATELDEKIGKLVETSVVVFVGFGNFVGLIKGSNSSPTHLSLATWLDGLVVDGKQVVPDGKGTLRAEVLMSDEQKKKLDDSEGVSMASVRVSTSKADAVVEAGSDIGQMLRTLRRNYGDMIVTVTMSVPRRRGSEDARRRLRLEAQRLESVASDAESVKAKLFNYDIDKKAHTEEVNFISQRITAKRKVPAFGGDGSPIRNESAVRAIRTAANEVHSALIALE